MSVRRLLLLFVAISLACVWMAPAAWALSAGVRVEASAETVSPRTVVGVASTSTFYDSSGNPYASKRANALAALAGAAAVRGFTWDATHEGSFVTSIGGFASLPDWSEGWVFAANGVGYPIVDVAAIAFPLRNGDETLWAQSPDATFARGSHALVTETGKRAFITGENLTITVKADDLGKVNSQGEYDRYKLTDPSLLETPAEFTPVEGAVLHVGSATYVTPADGAVTIAAPAAGTMRIWAEKPMDATTWYVRSPRTLVDFADPLALTNPGVAPATFRPGAQRTKVSFALSRAAKVVIQVRDAKNRTVFSKALRKGAGAGSYSWNGKGSNGRYVTRGASYTVRVRAVDTWSRSTGTTVLKLRTR